MFKICIAVLLQIVQCSTDEKTLEVMKALDFQADKAESNHKIESAVSKAIGTEASTGDQVLLLPYGRIVGQMNCSEERFQPAMTPKSVAITL